MQTSHRHAQATSAIGIFSLLLSGMRKYNSVKTQCGLQLPIHSSIKVQGFVHPNFLAGSPPGIHMLQMRLKLPIQEELGPAEKPNTLLFSCSPGNSIFVADTSESERVYCLKGAYASDARSLAVAVPTIGVATSIPACACGHQDSHFQALVSRSTLGCMLKRHAQGEGAPAVLKLY